MRIPLDLRFVLPCLLLIGFSVAQDKPSVQENSPQPRENGASLSESSAKNRKAYDALYSDIFKALPQDGKLKVDSARGRDPKTESPQASSTLTLEELKKNALEKRKRERDELSPEVKARVDKVLSGLDNRRKEKQAEFKELKE